MALHFKKPVPAVHHIFKNAKTNKEKPTKNQQKNMKNNRAMKSR